MKGTPLIVIEDPAHRRAVIEDHAPDRILAGGARSRVVRRRRLPRDRLGLGGGVLVRARFLPRGSSSQEHGLLDRSQATHLLPHPDLGVAVGLQDGLGDIA
jgi:hypothetical protein